jgi:hypothetical protein
VIVKPLNPVSSDSVGHTNDGTGDGDGNR